MTDEQAEKDDAEPKPAEGEAASDVEKPKKKKKKAKLDTDVDATVTDPRALEIAAAFDAGNFVRVRELGEALTKSGDDALVAVGRDHLARIAVDPIQIAFLGLCAVALLTIAWIYIPH